MLLLCFARLGEADILSDSQNYIFGFIEIEASSLSCIRPVQLNTILILPSH